MKTYRIYTERKNMKDIYKVLDLALGEYTVYNTTGAWQGKHEKSIVIEYICDGDKSYLIDDIAKTIKTINNQDAVFVTVSEVTGRLL
jgi:hypothetical protein